MGIGGVVEVVAPGQRRVLGGQHRELVAVEDAVAVFLFAVWALQQLPLLLVELFEFQIKGLVVHGQITVMGWTKSGAG